MRDSLVIELFRELQIHTGGGRLVFPALGRHMRPMSENTISVALRRIGYSNDQMTAHGFRSLARGSRELGKHLMVRGKRIVTPTVPPPVPPLKSGCQKDEGSISTLAGGDQQNDLTEQQFSTLQTDQTPSATQAIARALTASHNGA